MTNIFGSSETSSLPFLHRVIEVTGETPLTMRVGGHSSVSVSRAFRYSSASDGCDGASDVAAVAEEDEDGVLDTTRADGGGCGR